VAINYISAPNCNVLLGDFSATYGRSVSELLEIAFQFFATGVTCVAFPIKKNGGVSIKKAFPVQNSSLSEPQSKKTRNNLSQFVRDLRDVAKSSLHANEKFPSNGFNIDIFEQKFGSIETISITAFKQKGGFKNTVPTLTPRTAQLNDDTLATCLSVPLVALMAPFKLDPAGYTCLSTTFYDFTDQDRIYASIHVQSGENVTQVKSGKGFHRWLLSHFKSTAESSFTSVTSVNESHNNAMEWQEDFVDSAGDKSLHITPGGMKGRLFLKDLGLLREEIIDPKDTPPERDFLDAIELFSFMPQPSPNGNNQLKDDWKKSWYESRPPRSHLTARQVANIKRLASYNIPPSDIPSWVGASSMQQVRRVLRNESFRDVG